MPRLLILVCLLTARLFAQPQTVLFYNGADLQYICESFNQNSTTRTTWAITGATLTSVVVASNVATYTTATAHQLYHGARVTAAGSTAGVINGTFTVLTVPSPTTFTTALTAANGTYNNAGLSVYTDNPLLNVAKWNIQVMVIEAGVLRSSFYAVNRNYTQKCSDRGLF